MSIFRTIRQHRLLSFRLGSHHFNPGLFSTLVTLFFLYIMVSLGLWQLERAEYKDTLQQKIEQRKNLSAVSLENLPEAKDDRRYLPVSLLAEYDVQHSFLLDNITFKGRVGYHVFTPARLNSSNAVLIYRGFVAIGDSREQLPELKTPAGKTVFYGLLDLTPSKTIVLAENVQQMDHWPAVLQYVDLEEMSHALGYSLYDMVLILDEEKTIQYTGGFEYDIPVLNLNAAKNNGYAFQWFAMTTALLILFFVVNTKKDDSNNE